LPFYIQTMKRRLIGYLTKDCYANYSYNIDVDIIKWIKAYLDNRTQRVKINNSYSNWANVISGIPQGMHLRTSPFYYLYQ